MLQGKQHLALLNLEQGEQENNGWMVIITQVAAEEEHNLEQLEELEVLAEEEQVEHLFQQDKQIQAAAEEET